MHRIILLHTNDIHGRSEGLAGVVTLVNQIRTDNPDSTVLYMDAGDIEDTSNRLSNLTKGRSMHNLLSIAEPAVAAVGNGSILRYGWQVLQQHGEAVGCPLVLSNLQTPDGEQIPGSVPTTMLDIDGFQLGVIGLTAQVSLYQRFFDLQMPDTVRTVRRYYDDLIETGANAVMILSHCGLDEDRNIAEKLQGRILLIIGAHSHDLLPEGEQIGDVLIAQAGNYAEHLGRIDLVIEDEEISIEKASVIPVPEDLSPDPRLAQIESEIDAEMNIYLGEVIGNLVDELDWSETSECGVGNLAADALRDRFDADVGVMVASAGFNSGLPAGDVSRKKLWEVCDSSGNPGMVEMTGEQVAIFIETGLSPDLAADRPHSLRGRARGYMHLSGASVQDNNVHIENHPIEPHKIYKVAGSDFELMPNFGYTQSEWNLDFDFEVPTIIREVVEDYFAKQNAPLQIKNGRILT